MESATATPDLEDGGPEDEDVTSDDGAEASTEDGAEVTTESGPAVGPPPGARTHDEQTAELDERLGASLAEFDELMKRRQDEIDRERAAAPEMGSNGRPGGAGGGLSGAGSRDSGDDGEADDTSGGSNMPIDTAEGDETEGGTPGDEAEEGSPRDIPSDIPDGSDDDIVARQLREAAMKEEDPALREKLWQEYRDYKKGSKPRQRDGSGG